MSRPASPRIRAFTSALLASTALVGIGLVPLCPVPVRAEPLPTGGQVVSGGVTIGAPNGNALAITQSSQSAIVNWQGFSVGGGNRVDIHQPNANAAILNRVTGATPSTIAGQLNANGQVYLVNPNGVTITRSGQVNAAGFVASSLGISDEDFKAGRRPFRGSGASAPVTNHGAITIGRGGYAALIGGRVTNTGTIQVPMGRVGLGAGERATLDLSGDGFLQVAVPTQAKGRGALVEHAGTISADGGSVTLTAAAARDMARQAVNLSGVVEARAVAGRNGRITLSGGEGAVALAPNARLDASGLDGADGGRVRITGGRLDVAGRVDVSGARGGRARLKAGESLALSGRVLAEGRTGQGGRVTATAPTIATHAALIEASGASGGGVVRVGGGRLGQGPLARAERVTVDAASTIRADATVRGDGGDVVVWSDVATRFAGTITARGGASGGSGGQAEVSSKGVLSYDGTTVLTAARGAFGTLLLDPHDITIANAPDSGVSGFTATGERSVIDAARLLTALTTAHVVVSTGPTGNESGTITVAAPLTWNTGANLTLQAAGGIALNAPITAQAGGLILQAGAGSAVTATADLSVARFTLASGNWTQNAATLPGFATADFRIADGASFLRAVGGDGTNADPYRLSDVYGLQGMGSSADYRAASYRLASDIDAAGTATWWGGQGFVPVGTDAAPFTGSLDGAGHTVSGLTIARPNQSFVGLIGVLGTGGSVSSLGLVGGSVTGSDNVGGLVGNNSGTVSRSYASGSVTGSLDVGGLVGNNTGTVSQSYASGSVTGSSIVGGLVGSNTGPLTSTYWDTQTTGRANGVGAGSSSGATGLTTVQARSQAGYINPLDTTQSFDFGTVWYQAGDLRPILRSEAAAPVGGVIAVSNLHQLQLMGANLAGSYRLTRDLDASATAATDASTGPWGAGGFVPVGTNTAGFTGSLDGAGHTITGLTIARPSQNYVGLIGLLGAGGGVSGLGLVGGSVTGSSIVGGLVGTNNGTVSQSYASGSVTGSSGVGGLVGEMFNSATVSQSYASGSVTGFGSSVGGLVGFSSGTVSQSYASGSVTGSSNYVGGLVGFSSGTVSQSYASGSVTGSSIVGGLVGNNNYYGTVSQSYASGSVTGSSNVGGLVGRTDGALENTYWDAQTTGRANGVGAGSSAGSTGLTTVQARSQAGYINPLDTTQSFDFGTVWYQAGDMRPILRSEAAAPVGGVIAVSNLHQLQLMGANLAGSYRLTRDLDASATAATDASTGPWGAGGFVPVGTSSTPFTGSLDGAGHTITGLTIARPSQAGVGLIGFLGTGGRVSGLGLVGGSVSGSSIVGGLVGTNNGTVSQSYASGSVTGSSGVGGLVGEIYYGATVSQSYASGSVTGSSNSVGGLVGFNNGTVSQSYASGSATGSSSVGGLVGYNSGGTVSQSYASGSATGSSRVGGLVGNNDGTVSQSYASGSVSGSSSVGGLVGRTVGALENTYWDTQATGQSRGVGAGSSAGATGLTTAQMQDLASFRANYAGFDFATVWAPPNQVGQGGQGIAFYPQLYGLSNVVAVTPSSSRTYGSGSAPIASYAGLRPGDFVTTLGTLSSGASRTSDVGNYAVTASGTAVTSPAGNATRILYVPGTLSITPATITVTGATGVTKTYDGTTALPGGSTGFTSAGVLFGDDVRVAGNAAYDSARAGTRSVLVSGLSLSGAKAGNYVLSAVAGTGTIDRASLAVSGVTALDKTYDGTAAATLSGTATVTALAGDVVALGGTGIGSLADKNAGRNKPVTVTGYTLSGTDAGNYTLVQPTGLTADIARANLTVSGVTALDKTYDGTTAATLSGTATVFAFSGDVVALGGTGTGSFADKNAGRNKPVTVTGYTLSGTDAGNYTLVQPTGLTADIARANLAVSGVSAAGKTYDGTTAATLSGTATVFALTGDVVAVGGTGRGAFADKNAGRNKPVTVTGYTLTGTDAGNYVVIQPTGLTADIARANLTVSGVTALDKTYDGTTAATLSGTATVFAFTGDVVALGGTGTGSFADKNAGRNKPVTVTGYTLTGTDAGNYTLVQPTGLTADIARATLTYTADAVRRTYGAASPALTGTVTGFVPGESLASATTGTLAFGTTATASSNVDTYAITGSGLSAGNYVLVQAAGNAAALTVDPAALSISGARTYDATTGFTADQITVAGGVNGETLTLTAGSGTAASADAGTYAGSSLTGLRLAVAGGNGAAANYRLPATATLSITPAPVIVTARSGSSTYGDTPADPGLSASGLVGGEGVGVLTGLSSGFGLDAASAAGRYTLAVAGTLTNRNYRIDRIETGTFTVDPRALTVTADAQTRRYGDPNPALTYTVGGRGLVNGDRLAGALATGAAVTSGVGGYAVTQGSLAASANYRLTYQGADLAVTARPVTLSGTRVYDATTGIAGGLLTIANRVDGDSVSVSGTGTLAGRNAGTQTLADLSGLRLSNPNYTLAGAGGTVTVTQALLTARGAQGIDKTYDGTAALPAGRRLVDLAGILGTDAGRIGLDSIAAGYDSGDAGPRTITVSGLRLTGAEAANYRLSATSVIAAGTIAPASITVTAQGGRSVYGDTPADPGLSASGLVGGQDASVLTGLSNSFDLDAASAAGRYTLAVTGSLTNRNYVVADRRSGTWTVTPRALVVTPDALTRAYGEATPARGTAAGDGLVNGDRLDGVGLLTPATAASGVGRYALTGTDATFAAGSAGNYAITYTTRGHGLTIVPRAVTVTAQGQTRVYGDANPTLTYTVGGRGLADGDALSGSLATIATAGSGVGDYAITQGSLAASANYALTYQGADLAVTPRAVTLSGTRVYDGGTGFVGGLLTAGNLVNGDAVTVAGTGILAAKDAGSRALSDLSGLALSNPNYTLSGAAGTVAIMPATLTYTADAARRTYGSANPALTGRVAGFLGADTPANSTTGTLAFTTQAGAGSNVGSYAVTGSGLSAGNYLLVQAAGNATALTVAPALLTVTGTKTYDATTEFHAGQLAVAGGVTGETVTLTAGAGSPLSADAAIYTGSRLTGLRLAVAGGNGLASNYALPATGTLTITPALVTVAAEGGRSVYGDTPIDPGLSASGLVGGQDASVLTGLSSSFDLDATRAAGAYRLTVTGRLTNGNYRVGATEAGRYTIDRRPLTITADGLTRVYGDANPILTYTLGGRGLANGDRLTGVLATAADAASEPGLYRITRGSLSASANYSLGFVGADLAVLARPTQPQPEPRPIALAPSGLASSVERAARLDARPVAPDLPLLLGAGPDGALRVSDPRFDATLVCTSQQGGCFLTPLIAAPAPQAGLSAR
ncbi:YDG domain-containing protein [Methylobacterium sp. AMS5]|uniref:YDG domain-containing protein n=1 Tax=Methylobacterium sp. AMS5 TaxID=925818 RepID=UPI00074F8226|nr:YDG domain-containing protein [Methylobacterium sp. AMS5]AMB44414.1 hypothetical protein Y590_05855 [Methylobacterium sp. AMS5]